MTACNTVNKLIYDAILFFFEGFNGSIITGTNIHAVTLALKQKDKLIYLFKRCNCLYNNSYTFHKYTIHYIYIKRV